MSQQNVNTAAKESENTSGLKAAQLSIFDVPGIAVTGGPVADRRKQPALSAEGPERRLSASSGIPRLTTTGGPCSAILSRWPPVNSTWPG